MGRVTRIEYECDWCEVVAGPDEGTVDDPPSTWNWNDATYELLCPECAVARKRALDAAKAARKAGVPAQVRSNGERS
jgi:rubredoxin